MEDNSELFLQYRGPKTRMPALEPEVLLEAGLLRLSLLGDQSLRSQKHTLRKLGYSDRQCRRIFQQALGEPLEAFVRRMRLERAAGQLSVEEIPVSAIAEVAGFKSSAAFSKAFMNHFGCCASEFRILNRSEDCLMPGYLVARLGLAKLPKSVRVQARPGEFVRFLYDGPVFLGRVLPGGGIDWALPLERPWA